MHYVLRQGCTYGPGGAINDGDSVSVYSTLEDAVEAARSSSDLRQSEKYELEQTFEVSFVDGQWSMHCSIETCRCNDKERHTQ